LSRNNRNLSEIINLADARATSASASPTLLAGELGAIQDLLVQGRSTEAQSRLASFIKQVRRHPALLARARCAMSVSYEMQGRYSESLDAVSMYESSESRDELDEKTLASIRVQIGLAYNYKGDHPKAIALLNGALRESGDRGDEDHTGAIYAALARVYRSINEYTIARDHAKKALDHYRHTGDWRGMAEAYFGRALAELFEGNYEPALAEFEQALKLVGDRPASYLLGKIYTNMAGACWFLKRPHDGIRYLEQAISYYERTEHKANATDGYNNLGITLILVGDWDRAQEALEHALSLASEVDRQGAKVPMILDSLGELRLLRGDISEARANLERAVEIATQHGNRWYTWQPLRTLGRYYLAVDQPENALAQGLKALAIGESIGDRQAISESQLLLAESYLKKNELADCAAQLKAVAGDRSDSPADLAVSGDAQLLYGRLAFAQGDPQSAAQHFGRSASIFEMLGDRYRGALAQYWLGRAYFELLPARAAEHFAAAVETFRQLGARRNLADTETALAMLGEKNDAAAASNRSQALFETSSSESPVHLLTLRLTEAIASRELLLRELAAVLKQETDAERVLVIGHRENEHGDFVISHGWTDDDVQQTAAFLHEQHSDLEIDSIFAARRMSLTRLRPANAHPVTIVTCPQRTPLLNGNLSIDPLLRVVELGLDVCAFRDQAKGASNVREQSKSARQGLMEGFIHSSPSMARVVDEIHKIRSSDVTVLVTGESGTGKELVARAVHESSSRRAKVFVPFNCTAVPKELSDAYLFGYKRGAFTGAVADSAGVIRAAAGGTLFLDEVGDLPLEIQPKLLRFLQEGEIQPLGEQRPVKVDVRILAATNTDLEEMVAAGRFREDLYYRLNVIRLRVPPLRERRLEIPIIVNHYVEHYASRFGRTDVQISPETIDLLMVCDWPGNVRQLTNEIQRVVARAEDGTLITPDHLSPELQRTAAPASHNGGFMHNAPQPELFWKGMTLPDAVETLERRMIAEKLRKHAGNVTRTARELGLTRRGLQLKLGRYRMSAADSPTSE
jgi:hydrogenase-4 transcriptional activator